MPFLLVHLFIVAKTVLQKHRLCPSHPSQLSTLGRAPSWHYFTRSFLGDRFLVYLHVHVILDYSQVCGVVEKLQADISLVSD